MNIIPSDGIFRSEIKLVKLEHMFIDATPTFMSKILLFFHDLNKKSYKKLFYIKTSRNIKEVDQIVDVMEIVLRLNV